MKPHIFRPRIDICHRKYLCKNLGLKMDHTWVDLYDDQLTIELKSRMLGWKPEGKQAWAIPEDQIQKYSNTFPEENLRIMFMVYEMNMPVHSVRGALEKKIISRTCWIMPWTFLDMYPAKECTIGAFRYPKQKDFITDSHTIINDVKYNYCIKDVDTFYLLNKNKEVAF